jgi:AcrR family transcriptional regulator
MTQVLASNKPGRVATRDRIVAAALKCFAREGYEVGVDTIAAEAAVSKITLYKYFGEKRELFIEAVGSALDTRVEALMPDLARITADPDRLRDNLIRFSERWMRKVCDPQQLRLRVLVQYQSRDFPELARHWQEHGPDSTNRALAETFDYLNNVGALKIPDIGLAVTQFMGLVVSPFLDQLEPKLPSRAGQRRIIAAGVDVFLRSYAPA